MQWPIGSASTDYDSILTAAIPNYDSILTEMPSPIPDSNAYYSQLRHSNGTLYESSVTPIFVNNICELNSSPFSKLDRGNDVTNRRDSGSASNYTEGFRRVPTEPHLDSGMYDEHITSASVAKRLIKSYSAPAGINFRVFSVAPWSKPTFAFFCFDYL